MAARLSALRASRLLPSGSFLLLISVRGWIDPRVTVRLDLLGKLKESTSSETRTGDLPTCSIVPQPTALPRAPCNTVSGIITQHKIFLRNIMATKIKTHNVTEKATFIYCRQYCHWNKGDTETLEVENNISATFTGYYVIIHQDRRAKNGRKTCVRNIISDIIIYHQT
jgi:hypothetical protein